jgi:VCBS repeat-containing protein
MALDFGVVGDIFERDIGDGDMQSNAGNRNISRSLRRGIKFLSPSEKTTGGVNPSTYQTVNTFQFRPLSSKNMIMGLALKFNAKSAQSAGTWTGQIRITANNTTRNKFVSPGENQNHYGKFSLIDDGNYNLHNLYMAIPYEASGATQWNSNNMDTPMNDTSYTVEFMIIQGSTSHTMYTKDFELDIYYIDFEDVADEVIIE